LLEVLKVSAGSLADHLGIVRGDSIVSVNGAAVNDPIDFAFHSADEDLRIVIRSASGRRREVRVPDRGPQEFGVEFPLLRIRRCSNHCIFCFVDQMPKSCRKSLSVKDDDFRASFLHGNYITLSSLSDADRERIVTQRLSPLYISVHATDRALRSFMLGNPRAPDIMSELSGLASAGIAMHTQVVLCPGINDGTVLDQTIHDLSRLYPAVLSIAVVPVGLTSHRKGLYPIRQVTPAKARSVLETVHRYGLAFKKKRKTTLVFCADEFYLRARMPVPPFSFYEDFPQIENGVGMVASFIRDGRRTRLPARVTARSVTVVTGASFQAVLRPFLERLKTVKGLTVKLVVVRNRFFGSTITVAGLLTGQDILAALRGRRNGDLVLIPATALKEDAPVFLDDMHLDELSDRLSVPVVPVDFLSDAVRIIKQGNSS
jgi:putative radical SAM enzyme (TIGR03279 family)